MSIDPDAIAARIMRDAGLLRSDVVSALELASRFLNTDSVLEVSPSEVWGYGQATPDGRILVRECLHPHVRDFVILHEVAEIAVAREGIYFVDYLEKEHACDAIAGALIAPLEPFLDALEEYGLDLEALAVDFSTSQTAIALRYGEATTMPVRVLRPGLARTRGRPYDWTRATMRIEITDAAERHALLAAA